MGIADLIFKSDNEKNTFFSLNKSEVKEFEKDLSNTFNRAKNILKGEKGQTIIIDANQRINDRHFIVKWLIGQVKDSEEWIFCLHLFKEVSINKYLDSINDRNN